MKSIRMQLFCLLAFAAAGFGQAPTITSIVDPFTGGTKLAPGGQALITGTNLGLNPLVTVGGINAFNLVPPQFGTTITIEIPVTAAVGSTVPVVVSTGGGGPSTAFNIALIQYAPVLVSSTSGALTSPRHPNNVGVTAATPAAAGESITVYAIGLGPTTPTVNTGALGPPSPFALTNAQASVTFGANPAVNVTGRLANGQGFFGASYSGPLSGSAQALIGIYQFTFTVPSGTAAGSYPVSLSIGGATSNTLQLPVGPAPTVPVISAIVGESGKTTLCPGGVAIISGLNLGTAPTVSFGGKAAFVVNAPAGGNQMTVQIPVDAALGNTSVTLTNGAQTSAGFSVVLSQFAPALVPGGNGNPNPTFHISGTFQSVSQANPAIPGETIGLVVYGLGPTNPQVATGKVGPTNPVAETVTKPTVSVGGIPAAVNIAGLNNNTVGFYFVLFVVPSNVNTGNIPVFLSIGGQTTGLVTMQVFTGPVISNVTNAASNVNGVLPNGGIAQGSIFTVVGTNLGPGTIAIADKAFQNTSLSGTSMSVTVGGVTVTPGLYYTVSNKVAALLPSNTPTGTGTVTVTYNGVVGLAAPITVVQSNLGIFTVTSDGLGVGIVTYPDYSLVSPMKATNCGGPYTTCGAANPGDTLVIWATGLGPISGNDVAGDGLGVPMPNVPLSVTVGGVKAAIGYQGRGCCIGEDQIVFTIPDNAPTGCAVPLVTQIGNLVGNGTVIAIAPKGSRTCALSDPAIKDPSFVPTLTNSTAPFSFMQVTLNRDPNINGQGQINGNIDTGSVDALNFTLAPNLQPFGASLLDNPPIGTCVAYNQSQKPDIGNYFATFNPLDPGPNVKVTGPNGSQSIPTNGNTTLSATGAFLSPGSYTIAGTGGADIGSFTTPFTHPTPPTITSPAIGTNVNVTRANGLTITWTGGTSNSYLRILGGNSTDNSGTIGASFQCIAPVNAGTFTIPPNMLLPLPTGSFGGIEVRAFTVGNFTASKVALGIIQSEVSTQIFTTFQ